MGDRANIHVREDERDGGVYLYSHWGGSELPKDLQRAMKREIRWNDSSYLTRIIFDAMTEGEQGSETGNGISAQLGDGGERILEVNCDKQTISFKGKAWTFEEYIKLSESDIEAVWEAQS